MVETKTVYTGPYTNRRSAKLRQTDQALQAIAKAGKPLVSSDQQKLRWHEAAHIGGCRPGRIGRMVANVEVKNGSVVGCSITHDVLPYQNPPMGPLEAIRTSLAPMFVRRKPVFRASADDLLSIPKGIIASLIKW